MADQQPAVELCFRCGKPAEGETVFMSGGERESFPLCLGCYQRSRKEPDVFHELLRAEMKRRRESR